MKVEIFQKGTDIAVVRHNDGGGVSVFRTFSKNGSTDKVVDVAVNPAIDAMAVLARAVPLKGNVSADLAEALESAVSAAMAWGR